MSRRLFLPGALALAVASAICGCGSGSAAGARTSAYSPTSPEYELAKIDDHGATPSAAQVARYVTALDQLGRYCTNSRRQLAAWASHIKDYMDDADSEMFLLRLALKQAERFNRKRIVRASCRDVFVIIGADVDRYS